MRAASAPVAARIAPDDVGKCGARGVVVGLLWIGWVALDKLEFIKVPSGNALHALFSCDGRLALKLLSEVGQVSKGIGHITGVQRKCPLKPNIRNILTLFNPLPINCC
jgi:hypothetical protein